MSIQAYCPYCRKQVTAVIVNDEEVMHNPKRREGRLPSQERNATLIEAIRRAKSKLESFSSKKSA